MPGMLVRAQLQEGMRDDALLVQQRGITRDQTGQATALVVGADGKVEQRKVTVDRTVDTHWLVNDGLAAGDRVIVDGTPNVQPGEQVNAVAAAAEAGETAPPHTPSGKYEGDRESTRLNSRNYR